MNNIPLIRLIPAVCFLLASAGLLFLDPPINQVFVWQLSGILLMAGVFLLCWDIALQRRNVTAGIFIVGVALLQSIASFPDYPLFIVPVLVLLLCFWALLRVNGRSVLASLFGACIFVCSTWLPLSFITEGVKNEQLSFRDALIDPNQISVSHSSGGYIGVPAFLFAVAGIIIILKMLIQKRFTAVQAELFVCILLIISMYIAFIPGRFAYPAIIPVVVGCIAYLASFSFDAMQRFLGSRDMFIQTLIVILFCISLLDLMHITAQTFAYGLGI